MRVGSAREDGQLRMIKAEFDSNALTLWPEVCPAMGWMAVPRFAHVA